MFGKGDGQESSHRNTGEPRLVREICFEPYAAISDQTRKGWSRRQSGAPSPHCQAWCTRVTRSREVQGEWLPVEPLMPALVDRSCPEVETSRGARRDRVRSLRQVAFHLVGLYMNTGLGRSGYAHSLHPQRTSNEHPLQGRINVGDPSCLQSATGPSRVLRCTLWGVLECTS